MRCYCNHEVLLFVDDFFKTESDSFSASASTENTKTMLSGEEGKIYYRKKIYANRKAVQKGPRSIGSKYNMYLHK